MFGRILHVLDIVLTAFEEWFLYLMVIVGLVSLFAGVILRYEFSYTLAWSEELIRDVIIYSTFLGCSLAIKKKSMITIDALVQLVPRLKVPLGWVRHISVLLFSIIIFYYGIVLSIQKYDTFQKSIILEVPFVVLYLILPVMGFLMFVRTIQNIYKDYEETKRQKRAA
ncbi:MAG: TRAP transporter small permease subunit [Pseudomonadota bacterium]